MPRMKMVDQLAFSQHDRAVRPSARCDTIPSLRAAAAIASHRLHEQVVVGERPTLNEVLTDHHLADDAANARSLAAFRERMFLPERRFAPVLLKEPIDSALRLA